MFEVGRTIAEGELLGHTEFLGNAVFERHHVDVAGGIEVAPVEVEKRSANQFSGHEAHVVFGGSVDFNHERVGNQFTGFIVVSILLEQLRLKGPMFVELRGEFHKVAVNRSAALTLEAGT